MRVLLLALCGLVLLTAGCGYHHPAPVTGDALLRLELRPFTDHTGTTGLATLLDLALARRLRRAGYIVVPTGEDAPFRLSGSIDQVARGAATFENDGRSRELRLTLTVSYALTRAGEAQPLWRVQGHQESEIVPVADQGVASRDLEEQALARIAADLADDIFYRLVDTGRRLSLAAHRDHHDPARGPATHPD